MSDKTFKNIKKAAPFLFGAAQVFGSAIFTLILAIFLLANVIIGSMKINSLSERIEALEEKNQNIVEIQKEVEEQRKTLEILIAERKQQTKANKFDDALDKFLERTIKLGEALNKYEKEKQ